MNISKERLVEMLKNERFPLSVKYDAQWVLENEMGPSALWLMEWLCGEMDLKPGMRVLDMGCGRAMSAVFLAKEFGVQVWANDLWISASDNWQRVREAGVEDSVFPIHAEALPVILRALEIAEAEEISGNTPFALYLYNAGTSYLRTGNLDEAEVYLNRALAMLEERDETDTLEMTDVLNGTGFVLFKRGDCEGARSVMEEAMQLRARLKPLPDRGLAKMHFDIASVLECLGETQEAVKHMKIALDAYLSVYDPEHATVQMIREAYEDASETAAGRGSP